MLDWNERWCPVCRERLARRSREVRTVKARFHQQFLFCARCGQGWKLQKVRLKV